MFKRLTKTIRTGINFLFPRERFTQQTFTYFIPSPPDRKSGYREKQFDKIVFELLQRDYIIDHIHTENNSSGMWVILTLRTYKQNAEQDLNFPEILGEEIQNEICETNKVEGLYYID